MTFAVEETVFSYMINYCVGLVVAEGVRNTDHRPEIENLLVEHMADVREKSSGESVADFDSILPYREAYRKLGIDPDTFQSSIEFLISQAARGRGIPMVNPIADLVTAISLKYLVPMGAYDMDTLEERLDVRFSEDGDVFVPFGGDQREDVEPGEIVYASGYKVKMRKWIWRRSDDAKVRRGTTRIIIPIDGFEGINRDRVLAARDEVAGYLENSFGGSVATGYINYAQNAITTE